MLSLNWGYNKARIWLNELPAWQYQESELAERHLNVTTLNPSMRKSGAVELFVPRGGRFHYGALAMTFTAASTASGSLIIQIPILDSQNILQDALAKRVDTVYIGLLSEYAEGIFGVFQDDAALMQLLGSGTLHISGAAHGAVGSSSWIFQVLSRILVKLLTLEQADISDEQAISLIQEGLGETKIKRS